MDKKVRPQKQQKAGWLQAPQNGNIPKNQNSSFKLTDFSLQSK